MDKCPKCGALCCGLYRSEKCYKCGYEIPKTISWFEIDLLDFEELFEEDNKNA